MACGRFMIYMAKWYKRKLQDQIKEGTVYFSLYRIYKEKFSYITSSEKGRNGLQRVQKQHPFHGQVEHPKRELVYFSFSHPFGEERWLKLNVI